MKKYNVTINYMNKLARITLLYVIILILQISYTWYNVFYYHKQTNYELDTKIAFNLENYDELKKHLKRELQNRIDLLMDGKMDYAEWIQYNKDNMLVEFKGNKYYFFIFERGEDSSNEINTIKTLVHANPDYVELEWRDVMKMVNEDFVFLNQNTNTDLIKHFIEVGRKGITQMQYFWPDPLFQTPVEKESQIFTIPAGKDHNEMNIGIGIDLKNLDENNRFYYINDIQYGYVILISLLTFGISILTSLFTHNGSAYKPYSFLILTNLYLLYFLNNSEYQGTPETEIKKIDQINSGTLSVSFLVGVNTFIITSLTKSDKELYTQSAAVFAISVILLLFSSFKITDYITMYELIQARVSNQLVFNYSILLNIFVVTNYIISVIRNEKHLLRKLMYSKI